MSKIHQKSWSGGNGSELRVVMFFYFYGFVPKKFDSFVFLSLALARALIHVIVLNVTFDIALYEEGGRTYVYPAFEQLGA